MNALPLISRMMPFRSIAVFFIVFCAGISGCFVKDEPSQTTWAAMGSFASITVSGQDHERLVEYAACAKTTLAELENGLSIFRPESDIVRINQAAGESPVTVSADVAEALGCALQCAAISRGSFDPTVAPLVKLWGFNGGTPLSKPPDTTVIHAILPLIGYAHLTVSNRQAYLDTEGMEIDLGGIAKGCAVDVCYKKLAAMGAQNIIINLGGNIRCRGSAPGNRPWQIGVRNPFNRDEILGTIILTQGMAVATSGNYERFVDIGNERYTHIIDPRTGCPVKDMAGVTVLGVNAAEADGMSTALFVLGIKESRPVLARMKNCHALLIPDEHPVRIYLSAGFRKYFVCRPAYADKVIDL